MPCLSTGIFPFSRHDADYFGAHTCSSLSLLQHLFGPYAVSSNIFKYLQAYSLIFFAILRAHYHADFIDYIGSPGRYQAVCRPTIFYRSRRRSSRQKCPHIADFAFSFMIFTHEAARHYIISRRCYAQNAMKAVTIAARLKHILRSG